jgi:hypothetical protein
MTTANNPHCTQFVPHREYCVPRTGRPIGDCDIDKWLFVVKIHR